MEISKEAKYFGEIFDLKCSLERNTESCMKKNEKGIEYCSVYAAFTRPIL